MSKIKIKFPKGRDYIKDYIDGLEEKLQDSPLTFVPKEEIEKYEFDIEHAGYNPGVIDVFGNKVGVVMKQELRGALMDPSSDDLETLTSAGNTYRDFAIKKYGEKAKIPAETSFGRFIEDSTINSLIGNIFKFPTGEINIEKLRIYGLDKKEVLELADQAYNVHSQTLGSLNLGGAGSKLDTVGGTSKEYSGSSDSVNLSSDICESGSHLKLNIKYNKLQKEVQKNIPVFSEGYSDLERRAVDLMLNHNDSLSKQIATNLFRMYLNFGGLYDKGKALNIE